MHKSIVSSCLSELNEGYNRLWFDGESPPHHVLLVLLWQWSCCSAASPETFWGFSFCQSQFRTSRHLKCEVTAGGRERYKWRRKKDEKSERKTEQKTKTQRVDEMEKKEALRIRDAGVLETQIRSLPKSVNVIEPQTNTHTEYQNILWTSDRCNVFFKTVNIECTDTTEYF